MAARYDALNAIIASRPDDVWTCRQIYYQAVVAGLVEKSPQNAQLIGNALIFMRDNGLLDPDRIEDESREIHDENDGRSVADLVSIIPHNFGLEFWHQRDVHLQVWIEKRGLTEQARRITSIYNVPLIPAGGFASISIVRRAAELLVNSGKAYAVIMHLADFDASGRIAADAIERRYRDSALGINIRFERIGLNEQQIERFGLITQEFEHHSTNRHTGGWPFDFTAQLDALLPEQLRAIIEEGINRFMTREERDTIAARQDLIRDKLTRMLASDGFRALRRTFGVASDGAR